MEGGMGRGQGEGNPVLLQDVMGEIDPLLEPVLAKVSGSVRGCGR